MPRRNRRALSVTSAVLVAAGIARPMTGVHRAGPDAADFPPETVLVAYSPHGRTCFATEARWESMDFSPDGARLILRSAYDSFVLRAADLRVVQRLRRSYAWWEGPRVGYLAGWDRYILTGDHRLPVVIGRSEILAADPTGRFFLGRRLVRKGTDENGNTPTYRLQIWRRARNARLTLWRNLITETYDPGSQGDPHRLAVLARSAVVFGSPNVGAIGEDLMGVVQGGRVVSPLEDSKGRPLQFVGSPLVANGAITGIAEAVAPEGPHFMTGARFICRVTPRRITLRPIASNVRFVTYSPSRRAVGVGIAGRRGVRVTYMMPRLQPWRERRKLSLAETTASMACGIGARTAAARRR